jgi:metal-sulfur cluster biosynthetic enzyme
MRERVDSAEVERQARDELNRIIDPCSQAQAFGIGLIDMGLLRTVAVDPVPDGRFDVEVQMRTTAPGCTFMPTIEYAAQSAVEALPAVRTASIVWNIGVEWSEADIAPAVRERLTRRRAARLEEMRQATQRRRSERQAQSKAQHK